MKYLVKLDCFDHTKFNFEEHYFFNVEDADKFWKSYAETHDDFHIIKFVLPLDRFIKRKFHEIRCLEVPGDWEPHLND